MLACTSVDTEPYTHTLAELAVADPALRRPALVSDGLANIYEIRLESRPAQPHATQPDDKHCPQHRCVCVTIHVMMGCFTGALFIPLIFFIDECEKKFKNAKNQKNQNQKNQKNQKKQNRDSGPLNERFFPFMRVFAIVDLKPFRSEGTLHLARQALRLCPQQTQKQSVMT